MLNSKDSNKRNINQILLLSFILIVFAAFYSCKKDFSNRNQVSNHFLQNVSLAKTKTELQQLNVNLELNIIRTIAEFEAIMEATPLHKLSNKDKDDFKDNLMFKDTGGLSSMKYSAIQKLLSYDEFSEVMSLFGIDIKGGYWGLSNDPVIIQALNGDAAENDDIDVSSGRNYRCMANECVIAMGYICLSTDVC